MSFFFYLQCFFFYFIFFLFPFFFFYFTILYVETPLHLLLHHFFSHPSKHPLKKSPLVFLSPCQQEHRRFWICFWLLSLFNTYSFAVTTNFSSFPILFLLSFFFFYFILFQSCFACSFFLLFNLTWFYFGLSYSLIQRYSLRLCMQV